MTSKMANSNYHLPKGFSFAGVAAGIKASGKRDVALFVSQSPCVAAAVTTRNQVVAAPVVVCRQRTPASNIRAVVVNSGNANACTGQAGMQNALTMCGLTAEACGAFDGSDCLLMSTVIIGRLLPMERLEKGIRQAASVLSDSQDAFANAADAILTTDNARKVATAEFSVLGETIRIAAVAKGAGMIGPNMATMLCLVVTDAPLSEDQAAALLKRSADNSFNNISVEGHMSTNDTMLLLANGQASSQPWSEVECELFGAQLELLCIELAKKIPADGEGAQHLIEIRVDGAADRDAARQICVAIANSNLVKTAILGGDPNWGRIVSAAGYAGPHIDTSLLSLKLNGIELFAGGEPCAFDAKAASHSIKENFDTLIELVVGSGAGRCTHWTSDLTLDYVRFNSEYTT